MKQIIILFSFVLFFLRSSGQIVVVNNSQCDVLYSIKAHHIDHNPNVCTLESIDVVIPMGQFVQFNTPDIINGLQGWQGGVSAPSGYPPSHWAWESCKFTIDGVGGEVGNTTACAPATSWYGTPNCSGVNVTWNETSPNQVAVDFN